MKREDEQLAPAAETAREIVWEHQAIERGVQRYRGSLLRERKDGTLERRVLADLEPGKEIMRQVVGPACEAIDAAQKEAKLGLGIPNRGREAHWWLPILCLGSEEIAVIGVRAMLVSHDRELEREVPLRSVALEIGRAVKLQREFEIWKYEQGQMSKAANERGEWAPNHWRYMREFAPEINERAFRKWSKKSGHKVRHLEWLTRETRLHLGVKVAHLIASAAPEWFAIELQPRLSDTPWGKRYFTERVVTLTPRADEWITARHSHNELRRPLLVPMLIPPRSYQRIADGKAYSGGYCLLETQLLKAGLHRHTAALKDPVSDRMLDAVNLIQRTRWRINPFVLDVMSQAFYSGDRLGGLPQAEDLPMPAEIPASEWAAMSPKQRTEHKVRLSEMHGDNARRQGKRYAAGRKIALAADLKDEPVIYFPHDLDFRGRVYPLPQDLNPQGDDMAKALLMFADGKPLGSSGFRWLAIAMANAASQDKLSLEDRVKWCRDNEKQIVRSVEDPFEYRWWASEEFDSPWCFLALAQEYARALKEGPDCLSYVPVHIDATCSGVQHLSAMGRDPIGAKATNLLDTGARQDLYTEVAAAVKQIVANDAARGVAEAHHWVGHIERSTVKRGVMTTPYGVTEAGIRDQLIEDKHCAGLQGSTHSNAKYLTGAIVTALEETVVSAKEIMRYLQGCARALAERDIPLRWTTPLGMQIQQAYFNLTHSQVATLYGRVSLWTEDEACGLEIKRAVLGAAPNVVHSLDACHLAMTVLAANERGVSHFALIHDSYGTHASDVEKLGQVLRETFVELYAADRLQEFEHQFRAYASGVELPARPQQGTFDVRQVLSSPYFFS